MTDRDLQSNRRLLARLAPLWRDSRGATAVEYALIVSLIVIVMVVALVQVGAQSSSIWNNVNSKVTNAR